MREEVGRVVLRVGLVVGKGGGGEGGGWESCLRVGLVVGKGGGGEGGGWESCLRVGLAVGKGGGGEGGGWERSLRVRLIVGKGLREGLEPEESGYSPDAVLSSSHETRETKLAGLTPLISLSPYPPPPPFPQSPAQPPSIVKRDILPLPRHCPPFPPKVYRTQLSSLRPDRDVSDSSRSSAADKARQSGMTSCPDQRVTN